MVAERGTEFLCRPRIIFHHQHTSHGSHPGSVRPYAFGASGTI
jgi:hypothetical protein